MKTEHIMKKISSIPNGQFFRIRYISKCKQTAESLKEGYTLFKIVDTTTSTGVKYTNISGVQPSERSLEKEKTSEWLIKNKIKKNLNTDKAYLVLAPVEKASHTKVTYVLTNPDGITNTINKEAAKNYTIESYWREETPKYITVSLDNILLIK